MKARVLIVEDEALVAEDLRLCLKGLGYEVIGPVADGERAIALVEKERPDIVLMDIVIQGAKDGIETASIVTDKFQIPVVYLTANSDSETLSRAKITLPFGFVVKPYSEQILESNLQMALYHHEISRQRDELLNALSEALQHVKRLQGMLPICSFCKSIRDDQGYWQGVESYIGEHSEANFTHSVCPKCAEKHYSNLK